jgi:hypothetical protein
MRWNFEMGAEGERARTLWAWARYKMEQGDPMQGEAMWREARNPCERLGMTLEVEKMTDQMEQSR